MKSDQLRLWLFHLPPVAPPQIEAVLSPAGPTKKPRTTSYYGALLLLLVLKEEEEGHH